MLLLYNGYPAGLDASTMVIQLVLMLLSAYNGCLVSLDAAYNGCLAGLDAAYNGYPACLLLL